MDYLIHVERSTPVDFRDKTTETIAYRHPLYYPSKAADNNPHQPGLDCEFFTVNSRDLKAFMIALASNNPGRKVKVYKQVQEAEAPASDVVIKEVSEDGVLPTF